MPTKKSSSSSKPFDITKCRGYNFQVLKSLARVMPVSNIDQYHSREDLCQAIETQFYSVPNMDFITSINSYTSRNQKYLDFMDQSVADIYRIHPNATLNHVSALSSKIASAKADSTILNTVLTLNVKKNEIAVSKQQLNELKDKLKNEGNEDEKKEIASQIETATNILEENKIEYANLEKRVSQEEVEYIRGLLKKNNKPEFSELENLITQEQYDEGAKTYLRLKLFENLSDEEILNEIKNKDNYNYEDFKKLYSIKVQNNPDLENVELNRNGVKIPMKEFFA